MNDSKVTDIEPSSATADNNTNEDVVGETAEKPAISKKQQKRLLKVARHEATKSEYRAKQKEKRKRNRQNRQNTNNELPEGSKKPGKPFSKEDFITACKSSFGILIDCNWEDLHNDRAIVSLGQQIMYSYGVNRRALIPSQIHVTGVGNRLKSTFEKVKYEGWVGIDITSNDFNFPSIVNTNDSNTNGNSQLFTSSSKTPVYLTSESENTLTTLDTNCIYLIGGIVDRNKFKGITHEKALKMNIPTAKLPIKEHAELTSSTVLTVNHVVEILLKFAETKSWQEAIDCILPTRKRKRDGDDTDNSHGNQEEGKIDIAADPNPSADNETDAKPVSNQE